MSKRFQQKSLFVNGKGVHDISLSPLLKDILNIFQASPKERENATLHFKNYTYKISEKNLLSSVKELIEFAKHFRELRGSERQYMEESIIEALNIIIFHVYHVLNRPEKPRISIEKSSSTIKDEDRRNAVTTIINIADFIENTLDYVPLNRDALNGARKALAVSLIANLLACVEYPRLYSLIEKALLCGSKVVIMNTIQMIHYHEIKSEGIEKALETLIQTSKDRNILSHTELILADWRDELQEIVLFEDEDDEDDDIE
jgi:hypothetical protein